MRQKRKENARNACPRQLVILATAVMFFLIPQSSIAEEWNLEEKPWEKFAANFGVFLSATDSNFRIGSGVGVDIYEVAYSYSFFQDDRINLAAGLGYYIMPMDFGLNAAGLVNEEGSARFTAPLPVLGLRMDFALTPKWFIRKGSQIFYLE